VPRIITCRSCLRAQSSMWTLNRVRPIAGLVFLERFAHCQYARQRLGEPKGSCAEVREQDRSPRPGWIWVPLCVLPLTSGNFSEFRHEQVSHCAYQSECVPIVPTVQNQGSSLQGPTAVRTADAQAGCIPASLNVVVTVRKFATRGVS